MNVLLSGHPGLRYATRVVRPIGSTETTVINDIGTYGPGSTTASSHKASSHSLQLKIENCNTEDANPLAEIRAHAMRESLEAIGRFCPIKVRQRFLDEFRPDNTKKVTIENNVVAFYAHTEHSDHLYLDHLYVHPGYQGRQIGTFVINRVIGIAQGLGKPVKLGALKESPANGFYLSHGFVKTHEGEFDNYYVRR